MTGRLVGVGVGPGDPGLITLRALEELARAHTIFVPVTDPGGIGRAESVVRAHLGGAHVERLSFAVSGGTRGCRWEAAGRQVVRVLAGGGCAAFATIGDPNVYSTFSYLARVVRRLSPDVSIETVPGIMAMQDLAARSGTVLTEGDERLALLPLASGVARLRDELARYDTVVCYKAGRHLADIVEALHASGRLNGAVYGAHLGLEGQDIRPLGEVEALPGPYLATIIAPATRRVEGCAP